MEYVNPDCWLKRKEPGSWEFGGWMKPYEITYCCKCLVLFLLFNFLKALDSICRILSLLTPINSPISCSVFVIPSSSPNLHLTTCFSLGFRVSSTLFRSCFINCFMRISSDVSALGSAITSWKASKTDQSKPRTEDRKERLIFKSIQEDKKEDDGQTEGFRLWLIPIFWSKDLGALGISITALSLFIDSPVASAISS